MNVEREVSVEQAYHIAKNTIRDFNLHVEAQSYGVGLKTFRCKLIDDANKKIFFGFGKGLGLQSKVSAYYEALEHYALYVFSQQAASDLKNYRAVEKFPHPMPSVNLAEVETGKQYAMPIYLLDPRYTKCKSVHDKNDYSKHSWAANDSGVASGTSIVEAQIHALNEIVERDAHSLFLIEAFIKNNLDAIKIINKNTLPNYLSKIVNTIEQQYHEDMMLLDITSDIGIPVIYASMTKQNYPIQPSGCGASLSRNYALERALLESLQPRHVYNETLFANQEQIVRQFASAPLLQKAALADVKCLQDDNSIDFEDIPNYTNFSTLLAQLDIIIAKIKAKGFEVFSKPLIHKTHGFSCVKCLVPGLENFHLVQTGKYIMPNARGMSLIGNKFEKEQCFAKSKSGSVYGCSEI